MWLTVALAFSLAFGVSLFLTPLLIKLAPRLGAVDLPSHRKIHQQAMPCIGGVAIYLAFTAGILASGPPWPQTGALLLGGLVILAVGLVDDLRDLSPYLKLAGQVAAALIVAAYGFRVDFITHPFDQGVISLGVLAIPVTVFWIVSVTNAVNLIDGLDGLAAGVSSLAAVVLGIVAWREGQPLVGLWSFILAGSAAGFLRYNFHPARIFMGDSGAMFLGYCLAVFALQGLTKSTTAYSLIIPFVILGIPLLDTFFAIVRRLASGTPIFRADRDHLHHRLLAIGLSHRQTVLVIYGISILYGASAIALTYLATPQAFIILGLLTFATIAGAGGLGIFSLDQARSQADRSQHL